MMTNKYALTVSAMIGSTVILTACVAPDISAEIENSQKALLAVEKPVGDFLNAGEARALAQQVDELIRAGEFVYVPSEACYLTGNNEFTDAPCTVDEAFSPNSEVVRFRLAQAILAEMKAYLDALAELASSDAPEKIAGNTKQLFADLDNLSKTSQKALPSDVNARIQLRKTSAPLVLQFAADQARRIGIRRAVRQGDDAVELAVLTMIAFLRESDLAPHAGGLAEIDAAFERVEIAREANDPAAYEAALIEMRRTIDRTETGRKKSPEGQLITIRLAHRALAEKLFNSTSLNTVRDAVKTVADIQEAIRKEDEA